MNIHNFGRLGLLAVGLGIGAAVASSPGIASADSSTDWWSSIDGLLGGGGLAALSSSTLDYQISIDGHDLFPTTDNLASATSGTGDIAIAYGDGASASATGGTGDYAFADGSDALANAGGLSTDTGANNDTAIDIGTNTQTDPDIPDGAYAGDADLIGNDDGGTGSGDTAIDIGNNTTDGLDSGDDGAFAGAGGLAVGSGNGNNDTAIDFGDNSGAANNSAATAGNENYASESGNLTGVGNGVLAGVGNNDTAVAEGNITGDDAGGAGALFGNNNYAVAVGDSSGVDAGGESPTATGNGDIAYVLDPFATNGSEAFSGANDTVGGNYDLAAVLFSDGQIATAQGGDYLYDIISALGNESGAAASTGGGFLADLLSLF